MNDAQEIKIGEFTIYNDLRVREEKFVLISKDGVEGGAFKEADLAKVIRDFYNKNF